MIVDTKTGRIAYHSLILREEGGLRMEQKDYDGKPIERPIRSDEIFVPPLIQKPQ
jgi:hypothetical protein